ncbi:MAG TPA: hypothetical protein VI873_04090 [Candidatus Peribacteraceae bacterium]|nr:hypothetical protein [Candidatus Peribacteraceae bacterium]
MSQYQRLARLFFVSAAALLITVSVTEGLFQAASMQVSLIIQSGKERRLLLKKGPPSRRAVMERKDATNKNQVR